MTEVRSDRTALWQATVPVDTYPPRSGGAASTDVVVVGGGVTGLTTAALLVDEGLDVMVLEARHLTAGTTGGTTGKLTSQHGMLYRSLVRRHGESVARAYAQANQDAIGQVHELCARLGVDAGLEAADAFVYAQGDAALRELADEFSTVRRLGLPADWTDVTELPFDVAGAVRFRDQARLHPVKYGNGLARAIEATPNGSVHAATRVTSVRERGDGVEVVTDRGRIRARDVVLATLMPFSLRGLEFARGAPTRSHGLAVELEGPPPAGMYLSADRPTRSLRSHRDGGTDYLVVVGASHEVGRDPDPEDDEAALEAFVRGHFAVSRVTHRWSAQDYVPVDGLPLIGATAFARHVHVATGFQKWGLTNAMVAARILRDTITQRPGALARVFSPTRLEVTASARQLLEHNASAAVSFVRDRLQPQVDSVGDIAPGEGATVRSGGRVLAVHRDDDGRITTLSATCRHLGCTVRWNSDERSWDCPCHGARYAASGEVLEGPATSPLRHA